MSCMLVIAKAQIDKKLPKFSYSETILVFRLERII